MAKAKLSCESPRQQYSQQEFNIRRRLDSEDASCSSETSKHTSGFSTEMALSVASLIFTIGVYFSNCLSKFCNLDKQMKFL